MLDYRLLETLAAVVDAGGFDNAARVLHVSQSAVSQRLSALEDEVGQALVVRSTPPRATPTGQRLLRHYRHVHHLEADLLADLTPPDTAGFRSVPIAINADSLALWLVDALAPGKDLRLWFL